MNGSPRIVFKYCQQLAELDEPDELLEVNPTEKGPLREILALKVAGNAMEIYDPTEVDMPDDVHDAHTAYRVAREKYKAAACEVARFYMHIYTQTLQEDPEVLTEILAEPPKTLN